MDNKIEKNNNLPEIRSTLEDNLNIKLVGYRRGETAFFVKLLYLFYFISLLKKYTDQ